MPAAVAALLGHVCAPEPLAAHGPTGDTVSAHAPHTDPGGEDPALHLASCDGIRPTPMGLLVSAVETEPTATIRPVRIWSRPPHGAPSVAVSRPPLFILHAALLI
jgi:hypothetical protein